MGRNQNNSGHKDSLAGNQELYILEKALEKWNLGHQHILKVYESVPDQYHKPPVFVERGVTLLPRKNICRNFSTL